MKARKSEGMRWVDYTLELFRHIDVMQKGGNPGPPPMRPDGRRIGEPRGPALTEAELLLRGLGLGGIFGGL